MTLRRHVLVPLVTLGLIGGTGCSGTPGYRGSAVPAEPAKVAREPGWIRADRVPLVRQRAKDCGPAALSSVLGFWGKPTRADEVRSAVGRRQGERLKAGELRQYARERGFLAYAFYGSWSDIKHELENGRPVVVGVAKPYAKDRAVAHYEVVVGLNPKKQEVLVMDPAAGWTKSSLTGFESEWAPTNHVMLVVFPSETHQGSEVSLD